MKRTIVLSLLTIAGTWSLTHAEYKFFTPPGSYAVEISLENSPYLRLPIYRNAITSLEVLGDWIIGGTSAHAGKSPFLFLCSLSRRRLEQALDLEKSIPGQRAVRSGFGRGKEGTLYAGSMPDRAGDSGHLLAVKVENQSLALRDLGSPVPGEGVFALAADPERARVYGITSPSGKFFLHDLASGQTRIFDETSPSRRTKAFLHDYVLETEDYLCRRLMVDRKGRVWGSLPVNRLFCFLPDASRVEILKEELPEGWGRRALGRVDSWTMDDQGVLYGGCASDGQLFRLDPDSGKVFNLGKPIQMPGLKGLAFAADGRLYGIAGGAPGYSHLFSYDPLSGGFLDLGNPRFDMKAPGIEQGIPWRGFQIGTLAASEDGKFVVMGEEETLSQLMIFSVQEK